MMEKYGRLLPDVPMNVLNAESGDEDWREIAPSTIPDLQIAPSSERLGREKNKEKKKKNEKAVIVGVY